MPAAVSQNPRDGPAANDDLDDLFADLNENVVNQSLDQPDNMDEEIKVTRKRKPMAKLDETRLLSAAGVPKLRRIAKDKKLKFSGKGNEFTDMARLLGTYQLWLDDLFPKAKFLDGLAMVEKLGHKKRVQIYRKEWIDDGKPRNFEDDLDDILANRREGTLEQQTVNQTAKGAHEREEMLPRARHIESHNALTNNLTSAVPNGQSSDTHEPDEDDLDALLDEASMEDGAAVAGSLPRRDAGHDGSEPDDDELDALLAEDAQSGNVTKSLFGGPVSPNKAPVQKPLNNDFTDEEEAMVGMDW